MRDGVFGALRGHEAVLFGEDHATGLRAIVAVHSTALGPALGGTRFFPYPSEEAALTDVLRLSRAMTLKAAAAGVELGGGKAVVIGDPDRDKSEALLTAYGRLIEAVGGRYITAEDVGTTVEDMRVVRRATGWVTGLPIEEGGSGDPSPATARGVMAAMRAVSSRVWGTEVLAGRRVAVQGVGKVGSALVQGLVEAGCEVVVADVSEAAVMAAKGRHGVGSVGTAEALFTECDILAPCALGGVLDGETIPRLRCRAVVGSANNQLARDQDAALLAERGIVYAPDFVANAGGLINISEELRGYSPERAARAVDRIFERVLEVLVASEQRGVDPHRAATGLAEERVRSGAGFLRRSWRPLETTSGTERWGPQTRTGR